MLRPVSEEVALGEAEVRALIRISRFGTIAGSYVTSGTIRRGARARIVRDGAVIYETTIDSLKRFKDDVREVTEGFECGIHLDGFDDVKEGDVLEAYEVRQVERTALDETASAAVLGLPCSRPDGEHAHPRPIERWGTPSTLAVDDIALWRRTRRVTVRATRTEHVLQHRSAIRRDTSWYA